MKVLLLGIKYYPSKGGTSRVVENLIRELQDEVDFSIYCYTHPDSKTYIENVRSIEIPEIKIKGLGVFLYYILCGIHLLFKHDYDLIHIHKTDAGFLYKLTSLFAPTIFTSHALPQLNEKWSGLGKTYFRMVERSVMRSGITKTCISSVQKQYFEDTYKTSVNFIPNGIYKPVGLDLNLDDYLQSQHIEEPYMFFAARRVIPLKGVHTMLKALSQINYSGTIVIAGDIDQMPGYSNELRALGAELRVRFIGYISDMAVVNQLIKRADYFIFPSEIEGMSMMLLEAGIIGTPMICSDIPPNKAVLGDDEVLFFESKNVEDLASKILWAYDNQDAMRLKSVNTMNLIKSKYLMPSIARQYRDLYLETMTN